MYLYVVFPSKTNWHAFGVDPISKTCIRGDRANKTLKYQASRVRT